MHAGDNASPEQLPKRSIGKGGEYDPPCSVIHRMLVDAYPM
jgi:hypothetical protein